MYSLGVTSPAVANNAATLVGDGELLAAAEEERFTRNKHARFTPPVNAVTYCLERAGIGLEDIDHLAVGWGVAPEAPLTSDLHGPLHRAHRTLMPEFLSTLADRDPGITDRVTYVNHQRAHAASAYRVSGFDEANVITLDGNGERYAGLLGYADGDIQAFEHVSISQSLGHLYEEATEYLGFRRHRDEGKVMGLASYGQPTFDIPNARSSRQMLNLIQRMGLAKVPLDFETLASVYDGLRPVRRLSVAGKYPKTPLATGAINAVLPTEINRSLSERLFDDPFYNGAGEALTETHKNLAASVQRRVEREVLGLVEDLAKRTGCGKFCFAGGVALNCVLNKKIRASEYVDELFIQPAAHDAGTALGAALEVSYEHGERPTTVMEDVYWGPEYEDEVIERALETRGLAYERPSDPVGAAVSALADDQVVGWFQGRMEFGPRALGNRSILANPSREAMKDTVNAKVKRRELWRPFAPSLPAENVERLFEDAGPSPFMILSFDVEEEATGEIPAACHVDATARPQTVTPDTNERYYDLLTRFEAETGIPAVLNTSYNLAGDPINRDPGTAIDTFLSCGMDVLCLGDYVVRKESIDR
ncbi:carbamoyltransferase family protein [Natrinema salsiterrestre]|uniref:Carbamoyltransferase n=1 Tax=Natrinema salsiterrestre TaxID=2950540 RepID=A0A9Q4L1E0_9EURY|nr:carbamoyltransferase C-terminal domain-containing protein [Natrinema salsiterrestre]MDF9745837.1 hypothetical protein [Natrinema salsiterrestre]